ncbi:MAG: DNA-processing protein DprA [Bacteroidales bacterium]|nr:DNA-processing protein DprA [Bacteroidales bacterium]
METIDYERICACALGEIFGYEPHYGLELMCRFGSAAAVFGDKCAADFGIGGPSLPGKPSAAEGLLPPKHRGKLTAQALEKAAVRLKELHARGCTFIAWSEPAYPPLLKECPDAPAGLYLRSDTPPESIFRNCAEAMDAIAIVGTRDISPYGRLYTHKIVESIAASPAKPLIVSGLAIGVDICAHIAALENGIGTIAVLPCGIDSVYPNAHRRAAERIASSPGSAIITDYPPGTAPMQHTFVRRNRIIAGIARACIVVESKARGGSLITARHALDYNRDIYALPGRIDDFRSQGCNELIRNHFADIITSPETLAESLGLRSLGGFGRREKEPREAKIRSLLEQKDDTNNLAMPIIRIIRDNCGISIERIADCLKRPYPEVLRTVGMLRCDGIITMDLCQRCSIAPEHAAKNG